MGVSFFQYCTCNYNNNIPSLSLYDSLGVSCVCVCVLCPLSSLSLSLSLFHFSFLWFIFYYVVWERDGDCDIDIDIDIIATLKIPISSHRITTTYYFASLCGIDFLNQLVDVQFCTCNAAIICCVLHVNFCMQIFNDIGISLVHPLTTGACGKKNPKQQQNNCFV